MTSYQFFREVPLREIVASKQPVISIDAESYAEEALRILKEKNILSLPVYDSKGLCLGILDIFDIMTHTIWGVYFADKSPEKQESFTDFSKIKMKDIIREEYLGKPKRTFFFESNQSLDALMKTLSTNIHRVIVSTTDSNGIQGHKILSQWDVVEYLWRNMSKLNRQVLIKSVRDLGYGSSKKFKFEPVWCIGKNDSALYGFKRMYFHDVRAVAVVDDSGKLIGNLSSSDLRGITSENLALVQLSAIEFLKKINESKDIQKMITCHPNDRFKEIMTKMMISKVHRVWIVDSECRPIGVLTLTDIIKTLLEYKSPKAFLQTTSSE